MLILVLGMEFSNLTFIHNTQCSSQVPSLIPTPHHFTHLPLPSPLVTTSLFSIVKSLFRGFPFILTPCSFVLFLKFHTQCSSTCSLATDQKALEPRTSQLGCVPRWLGTKLQQSAPRALYLLGTYQGAWHVADTQQTFNEWRCWSGKICPS